MYVVKCAVCAVVSWLLMFAVCRCWLCVVDCGLRFALKCVVSCVLLYVVCRLLLVGSCSSLGVYWLRFGVCAVRCCLLRVVCSLVRV